jgi:hypothetical protein
MPTTKSEAPGLYVFKSSTSRLVFGHVHASLFARHYQHLRICRLGLGSRMQHSLS